MSDERSRGQLTIHIDGAARGNPGPAGIGVVVIGEDKRKITLSEYIGETTNNVAEYTALLRALEIPEVRDANAIELYSDSELLVKQLNGFYKVKNSNLQRLFGKAKKELAGFVKFTINYIPREENKIADQLASGAIDRFLQGEDDKKTKFSPDPDQERLF